jgi:hypothetical protein
VTRILGIETSCDETSAAIVDGAGDDVRLESLVILSQDVHRLFGGVVPEIASRQHLTALVPVVNRAIEDAGASYDTIDAIAVTHAPGLVGALPEETMTRGTTHTAIARESGAVRAIVLVPLLYAATHFFAKPRIPPDQVGPGSGLDMLAGILTSFANPLGILDAFLCLFMVGVLLGMTRHLTGNIAACIGLHASWVAIITVVRATSERRESGPVAFLMSDYDGFIGWMVLAWTVVIGWALWWWYQRGDRKAAGE